MEQLKNPELNSLVQQERLYNLAAAVFRGFSTLLFGGFLGVALGGVIASVTAGSAHSLFVSTSLGLIFLAIMARVVAIIAHIQGRKATTELEAKAHALIQSALNEIMATTGAKTFTFDEWLDKQKKKVDSDLH